MKYILTILLFVFSQSLFAQQFNYVETYSIDSVTVDSFYLRTETITATTTGRPDTLVTYQLFTDTTDFILFVGNKLEEISSLDTRFGYLKRERDTLSARYDRLVALGGSAESPFRMFKKPPEEQVINEGFWVIYPPSSQAEYIFNVEEIRTDCIILNRNGTSMLFEVPKKKKSSHKKKVKKE